jgi:hypothetical protein
MFIREYTAKCLSFLLVIVCLATSSAWAQTQGQITGEVTDSTGGLVVSAAVTVTNPETNFTRVATTNSAGNYTFPSLLPGVYNIKAEKEGFQTEIRDRVELQVEQVARIDFQLKVGTMAETVEVAGGAPQLNTENATVGTVIENKRITDLPLNGRNFLQLVGLSPNVSASFANGGQASAIQGGDRSTQQISVSGNRREFNYFTLDGVDNTDVNFNTYIFLPSIDALQEFKIQTGVYSAEFGRATTQVNVSSKSGTNGYHGAVFEFIRNSDLDARPYAFTRSVPAHAPFKWNQYGFTLGGPVWIPKLFNGRNRLFFMANFEGFRLHNQTQNINSTAPPAMRAGDFSQILPATVITDPLANNQPFPNNQIPSVRLDPISQKLLEFFPAPNIAGTGLANNYLALDNNVTNKDQFTQRIDFVESSKSSWFGRFSWDDELNIAPVLYLNGQNLQTHVDQWMIDNTRVFKPNLVNEFRFGYNHFFNNLGPQLAYVRDVVQEFNIPLLAYPAPSAWGSPAIGVLGYSGFGDNSGSPYTNFDHTFQWADNVSWIRGTHSMRFGAEIRRDRYNETGNYYARGAFGVQNQATGYGFSDYMLGYIHDNSDSAALAVSQFRATSQAYFIADNWKVRSNLTIDYGLRYEFVPPWSDRGDSLINAYLPDNVMTANAPPSTHPCLVRIGNGDFYANTIIRFDPSICVARDGRLGPNLVASDYTNFAPRLGIAWSASPKWTVRLGAGFFYVQDTGNPRFDMSRNLAGRIALTANTQIHDLTFEHPFGLGAANACGVPSPPFICISIPQALGNDYNRRTPYVEQFELNLQRQLSANTVAEIGYLGSEGHRLERLLGDNQPTPSAIGSVQSRRPFPEFGPIQEVIGIVNSNYNSLSAKLTRRMSAGLTYLVGYTYSKSIDDGSGIRAIGTDPLYPQNSFCVACDRGLSVFDARNRFVTSVLYDLPIGKGRKFLSHGVASSIVGGWELSSIWTVSSGFPLNITDGVDRSNTGIGGSYDRPNSIGANPKLSNPSTGEWFNIQSFSLQPLGSFGNLGRNVVRGPGILSADFSIKKNFNFNERTYLQFRFEAFNALNHPNLGDPNTTLANDALNASGVAIPGTGSFGSITSTRSDMRELQFSLKLIF